MQLLAASASFRSVVFKLFWSCLPPNRKWMRNFLDAGSWLSAETRVPPTLPHSSSS